MIDYQQELENRGLDPYPSGDGYIMMRCPMHDDENPSFSVSLKNGSYRCFGCEERGTFAELTAYLDGVTVDDAMRLLKSEDSVGDALSMLERSLEDNEDTMKVFSEKSFHSVFPPVWGTPGEWYLRAKHGATKPSIDKPRSLSKEIIERFDGRWAPSGKYRGRVIFPIRTPAGKIVSYVGRSIYAGVVPKTRKSVTPRHTLFGIYELLQYFGKVTHVVLVEGEFDAMYLQQFGIPALAVMGTAPLSIYQIRLLRSLRAMVVLSYDGDSAGAKAMFGNGKKRKGEINVLSGLMPTIAVVLPESKDPNDLLKREVIGIYGRFRNYLRKSAGSSI